MNLGPGTMPGEASAHDETLTEIRGQPMVTAAAGLIAHPCTPERIRRRYARTRAASFLFRENLHGRLSLLLIPSGAETPAFWAPQRQASLVVPTRRDDLKLSRGATAKLRENAEAGSCGGDQHYRHHPERPGFPRWTELIGGTGRLSRCPRPGDFRRSRGLLFVTAVLKG